MAGLGRYVLVLNTQDFFEALYFAYGATVVHSGKRMVGENQISLL